MKHLFFQNQPKQSNNSLNNILYIKKTNWPKSPVTLVAILLSLVISLTASAASVTNTKIVSNNIEYDLLISLPDNYDTTQVYSLVLALQPCMSAPTKNYLTALQPLTDSLNMIVISPDLSKTGNWMNDANFGVITTSIDSALTMYSIDPQSVYLTGMSCNGATTLQQGLKKMYPFKGIFPWDPYLTSVNPKIMDLNSDMPVTIAVGTKDDYLAATLNMYDSLKAHGSPVNLILVEGIAHTYSFANFGNEMIHSLYYLMYPNTISIDYADGTLPNFEITNTGPTKELVFKLTGETGHKYEVSSVSSNSALIANPAISYSEADNSIKLSFTPTAGKTGKVVITLEAHEKDGTAYTMVAFNVKVIKPTATNVADMESEFAVYPNPASDWLFIKTSEEKLEISILDLNGKRIMKLKTGAHSPINISSLNNGIYLANIKGEKKQLHSYFEVHK